MRRLMQCAMLTCASMVCGCGSSAEPPVPVYPVTGTVTYKGTPVVGADITFFNKEANRSSFGRTNEQGEYQLTTFSANDGAVAGKSIVTIVKFEAPPMATTDVASIDTEEYVPPGANQSTDPPKPKSEFPDKYGKQETSGLVAMVNADAPNKVDFNLTD